MDEPRFDDWDRLLGETQRFAREWLDSLPDRRVAPIEGVEAIRARFPGDLPDQGEPPATVIEELARAAEPGLVASPGGRYFGFVIGGTLPASVAADWLTSAWDQNAALYVASPASSVIEELAARWVLDLLGLPATAGVGFATGATMANFTCLAAARSKVLQDAGWDVEEQGLVGSPPIRIVIGAEAHAAVPYALRLLGLGAATATRVPVDGQGAMRVDALRDALRAGNGGGAEPTIVVAQAGNVNSGAFDPIDEIAHAVHDAGGWLHVDGAFGLWAAASPRFRHLAAGLDHADSWTTDAHKWLNVPYDGGIAIVADSRWQRRSMAQTASYLLAADRERDSLDYVAEASRRARGTTVYAALRSLGRSGVAALVERCCDLADRFAERLEGRPGIRVLNDVVLNQVLVRFEVDGGDPALGDARTREVVAAIQRDGTMWAGGTTWHGLAAMRISVSSWMTTAADVDRSVEAIVRIAGSIGGPAAG